MCLSPFSRSWEVFVAAGGVGTGRWPAVVWLLEGAPWLVSVDVRGQSVDPPSLPISPVLRDSLDDSVVANVGSSREESNITSEAVVVPPTVVDDFPAEIVSGPDIVLDSLSPVGGGPFSESLVDAVIDLPKCLTGRGGRRPPGVVPRWRLAREGPFPMERSSKSIRCLGAGCPFRKTTYCASDYASPSGEFGIPLHYPRFLEWIGVPESAGLLEMGPGRWPEMAAFSGSGDGCGYPATSRCVFDGNEFGCPRSVCLLTARHGIQYSGIRTGFAWFPISGSGGGCSGTPRPPRFCPNGGHGSVATLTGSG